ncbi:branched-chain amino acid ABC transporter permease [Clostridium sp. AL.422]|uniref:branched-chain amino acid ABC transporter permease n=1 Tax=Clostridium TaxID=1485 RepID=UPI00293DBBD8|nr:MULTISPECIES: branched-chain amino acid ABC transporter permease [unclassified Clostridium]MDV4150463.1 branched-chain amino acid ABC transporter permease [Clostridium sp. AL.422]
MKNLLKSKNLLIILGALIFAIITPLITNNYSMGVMNLVIIYFIAALGLTILIGMAGQVSFAVVAFLGFGSYSYAILTINFSLPPVLAIVLATALTSIFGYILGMILFRLKGTYFTFATIGFVQIMANIYLNWEPVTGGPNGITGIPNLTIAGIGPKTPIQWFYLLMVIGVIVLFLVENIRKTSLGRALAAVRDNEIAAKSLGVDVFKTKVIAFAIAAALAGLAGALLAPHNKAISAYLYTYDLTINYIIMVMLGGVNSTVGTFVGSFLVTMLPETLRVLNEYMRLIYGVTIILLMIFMPMGLAGGLKSLKIMLSKRQIKKTLEPEIVKLEPEIAKSEPEIIKLENEISTLQKEAD